MACGIFNVRRDVNACDCTRRCTDTVRESALKVDSGRKIPCRTGESNLRRRRASAMLYQVSYIPTHDQFLSFCSALHCPPALSELQACPFPDDFPALLLSALVVFPHSLCLARRFWLNLMNGRHVRATAFYVSLRWPGPHEGLRVRCVVSCCSTSFPWLVFFIAALL